MRSSIVPSLVGGAMLAAAGASAKYFEARGAPNEVEMVAASWYTGWHISTMGIDAIPWDKYTHVTYAFGVPSKDPSNITLGTAGDDENLPKFVEAAHAHGVKALLSVGGWAGSIFYSTSVGVESNRTAFVKALVNLVDQYQLDGIDFDWEYPNKQGIGCNAISSDDTSNLLSTLQALRADPTGSKLILSAAVSLTPFVDASGSPSTDVSAFAKVLDWIAIMNYDVWGTWSTSVGPNAPLDDSCAASENKQGSAVSAVAAWTGAQMPIHQIVLGVAAYGHSFAVNASSAFADGSKTELAAYPSFDATAHPLGDAWDNAAGTPDACGNIQTNSGVRAMWNLVQSGLLNADGTPAASTPHRFDSCSQTDYVYDASAGVEISYDSPQAFEAKGKLIAEKGLRGFAMWEAAGDSNNILVNAILEGAGVGGNDGGDGGDGADECV